MPHHVGHRRRLAATTALACLITASAAAAQEATTTPSTALEEVVVTAQRRSESSQRAALSVEVVSASDIAAENRNTVESVLSTVPSVVVQGTTPGANVYVRGIGTNSSSADPSINLNIDGVYLQRPLALMGSVYDLSRVEVLRGPQGTLYGRNANAGSVNIITADPSLERFSADVRASLGNYDARRGELVVNAPLSSKVAARLALVSDRQDGYLSNGNDDVRMDAARLKVLVTPTQALRLTVYTDYMSMGGQGGGTVRAPLSSHDDAWSSDLAVNSQKITNAISYVKADWDLGWATLTLQPSYVHSDTKTDSAQSTTPQAYGGEETNWAGEARLSSPAGGRVTWVAGLYGFDSTITQETFQSKIPGAAIFTLQGSTAKAASYAAFGQATFPLSERLRLTTGLRYTSDEKSYLQYTASSRSSNDKRWNNLTYKLGFEYDLAPRSMLYGSVSTGFKAGGFAATDPPQAYDPEEITALTLGSKNLFLDGRLRLNLEAFRYDYTGYQVTFPVLVNGVFAQVTVNAASAKPYGADAELEYALTAHSRLSLAASFLESKYGDFRYTDVGGARNFTGRQLLQSPRWSGSIAYQHEFPLANGAEIQARVQSRLSSSYPIALQGQDIVQDAFTRTDASLTWQAPGRAWSLGVYARNLEDEAVRTFALYTPTLTTLKLQAPRTYGVQVSAHF